MSRSPTHVAARVLGPALLACLGWAAAGAALHAQTPPGERPEGQAVPGRGEASPTLQRTVTLRVRGVPLAEALRQLQLAGVPLVYSGDAVEAVRSVNCECEGVAVGEALARLTANTRLRYRELESGAVVLFSSAAQAAAAAITGRVEDAESGARLRGASVRVTGTDWHAWADENGHFAIPDVPPGEYRIEAAMIGYRTEERAVRVGESGRVQASFALRVSPVTIHPLDVTVSTGTAIAAEQRSVGHAVTVIDAGEIRRSGARDLPELMRGRVPGVFSTVHGGTVDAGSDLRIRGTGSILHSQAPLLYIDGVAIDQGRNPLLVHSRLGYIESANTAHRRLDEIPLDEIERIEIVKGPAATTVYGTGAANGVIHVFTRRGVVGRTRFRVTSEQGVSTLDGTRSFLNNSPGREQIQRDLLRRGREQRYTASLSGGAPNITYTLDLARDDAAGVLVRNGQSQTTVRFGSRIVARDDVTLQISATALQRNIETRAYRGMFGLADVLATNFPFVRPTSWEHGVDQGVRGEIDVTRAYGSAMLEFRPSRHFHARVTAGGDASNEITDFIGYYDTAEGIRRDYAQANYRRGSVTALASVAYPHEGRLTSTVSFGVDGFHDHVNSLYAWASRLPHMDAKLFRLGRGGQPTDSYSAVLNAGGFVQQQIGLWDRLFLTLGLRADGNSAFGDNYGVRLNPKLSAAYAFALGPSWEGKFRAGWGQSSRAPDPFAKDTVFRHEYSFHTDSLVQTLRSPGNPDLRPETVTEFETGIDQYLLGNRASLELTYFHQRSRDVILRQPVAPISGFPVGPPANLGGLRSRGVEVTARATAVEHRQAQLTLGLSFTHMLENGTVTSLGDLEFLDPRSTADWHPALNTPVGGSVMELAFPSALVPAEAGIQAARVVVGSRVPTTYGGASLDLHLLERVRLAAHWTFGVGGFAWDNVQLARDLQAGRISTVAVFDPEVARERYVFSTDHLRLDALRIEYTLPQRPFGLAADQARLWVQASNLHTADRFGRGDVTTVNPTSSGFGTLYGPTGTLNYDLPVPRAVRAGVQLNF